MKSQPILKLTLAAVVIATFNIVVAVYSAEARPSTKSFTCKGAQNFVRQRGAVVMNHKASHLYQRFVDSRRFCSYPKNTTKRFKVPTRSGACYLKVCHERVRLFDN